MYDILNKDEFAIIRILRKDIEVELLNYGAAIYGIKTRDYQGKMEDIVLKYKNLDDYINNNIYLNATIGPISGRIRDGIVKVLDKEYHFDLNSDGLHTLHSGKYAVTYKYFDYEITEDEDYTEVVFLYETSEPVNYLLRVFYRVYDNMIRNDYEVETDKVFVFNLTNHAYFNLSGNLKENIRNHHVSLSSNLRHEVDKYLVFTGNVIEEQDIYDFRKSKAVEDAIRVLEKTPKGGIDDIYYVPNNNLRKIVATVYDPISKRMMKVRSSMDHIVFYSHNNINNLPLEYLGEHKKHYALCFECQNGPYGFNDEFAKKSLLKPRKLMKETIIFEFYNKFIQKL